jgi:hypothetical protein
MKRPLADHIVSTIFNARVSSHQNGENIPFVAVGDKVRINDRRHCVASHEEE